MAIKLRTLGVQARVMGVFTLINLVATLAYSMFVFEIKSTAITNEIDARLSVAAHALPGMLPPHYLEATPPLSQARDPAWYAQMAQSLHAYCRSVGLRYLYAFVEHEGKIVYLIDAASPEEIQANHYGHFLAPYTSPVPALSASFRDGQVRYAEYTDEYGQFRSIFLPGVGQDGRRYVIGADIDIAAVEALVRNALLASVGIGLAIFLLSLFLSWRIARSIVQPVKALLKVTEKITDGDYSLTADSSRSDEVGRLAQGLNTMGAAIAQRERDMLKLLYCDELTGSGNRLALAEAIETALLKGEHGLLILVHLDRLRAINDLLGFSAGDHALKEIYARLSQVPIDHASVFRMGGNVFAVLVPHAPTGSSAAFVQQLLAMVEGHPFMFHSQPIDLSLTLGLARYPEHGDYAGILLRNAEVALHTASRQGQVWCDFHLSQIVSHKEQLSLLGELRRAIEQHELHVFYQPQVRIADHTLVQAEALIRWLHPVRGWMLPGSFIPFAERAGRMSALTDWMLDAVCRQLAVWRAEGRPLVVAVNVAIRDLEDVNFPQRVAAAVARYGVLPVDLCLEITESGLMANPDQAHHSLDLLHAAGHPLTIDDFGTGYSSLAYLSRLPVDELKIDQSFIADLTPHNRSIVLSTIGLGHALSLRVVAEGVETEETFRALAALGCDVAQGYMIARALPLEAFESWRQQHRQLSY